LKSRTSAVRPTELHAYPKRLADPEFDEINSLVATGVESASAAKVPLNSIMRLSFSIESCPGWL
jgi:hypothetical protein